MHERSQDPMHRVGGGPYRRRNRRSAKGTFDERVGHSELGDKPGVRARFTEFGLDIAAREQQTSEGLAAFHKTEVEKWWPIIKAANTKGE